MNLSSGWGDCFAWGSVSALELKQRHCPSFFGPYPFVSGPFELLSQDVVRWITPRLPLAGGFQSDATHRASTSSPFVPASMQRCQFEDRLLGLVLALHPRIRLVNLAGTIGPRMNVISGRGEWHGPDSFVAHWVRRNDLFERLASEYLAIEDTTGRVRRNGHTFCSAAASRVAQGGKTAEDAKAAAAFCSHMRLKLRCQSWSSEFELLRRFPCCQDWESCVAPPRGAFVQWRRNRSRVAAGTWQSQSVRRRRRALS